MIDPETRAYLDEGWTMRRLESGTCAPFALYGSDGDTIAVLTCRNAAHFLTPEAMGEYLMELHSDHVSQEATLAAVEAAEPGFSRGGSTRQKVRRIRGGGA